MSGSYLIPSAEIFLPPSEFLGTPVCLEWIELDIGNFRVSELPVSDHHKIFKALSVYKYIIGPDENTDVDHIPKDLHHTYLTFHDRRNCQNPLKGIETQDPSGYFQVLEVHLEDWKKSRHWLDLGVCITAIQSHPELVRTSWRGTVTTGEDHRLLGFLLMNPFFSSIQSLCFGA